MVIQKTMLDTAAAVGGLHRRPCGGGPPRTARRPQASRSRSPSAGLALRTRFTVLRTDPGRRVRSTTSSAGDGRTRGTRYDGSRSTRGRTSSSRGARPAGNWGTTPAARARRDRRPPGPHRARAGGPAAADDPVTAGRADRVLRRLARARLPVARAAGRRRAPRQARRRDAGAPLVMRAPNGPSGVYLLELRAGRGTARVPFIVQSEARAKILVVVPAITWLGTDHVDDGRDGVPNTLATAAPCTGRASSRPRAAGGLRRPGRAAARLPRPHHIRYDLTTDLAGARRSRDPRATDRDGVLLAGPQKLGPARRWRVACALRARRWAGRVLRRRHAAPRRDAAPRRRRRGPARARRSRRTPTRSARGWPSRRGAAAVPLT